MIRKYNPEKAGRAVKAAAKMPELRHNLTEPFDITQSEVMKWLCQQPEILQASFDYYRDKGAIVFDKEAGTWKGFEAGSSSQQENQRDRD